jgi:predicted metal-dependent hydrolase
VTRQPGRESRAGDGDRDTDLDADTDTDTDTDRDRDADGRARNARPRDLLGRPLPRSAVGQSPIADDRALPPVQALAAAQALLDAGQPFHAHEVLEAAWKAAPPAERDLWQGLAQVAVGLTHALRGNARGAVALLRRGADRLDGYPTPGPHDIDVDGVQQACLALADSIEATGLAELNPSARRIRLRAERSSASGG